MVIARVCIARIMIEMFAEEHNVAAARFWRRVATSVVGENVREEHRPVPGKPQVPPDVWITITVG